MFRGTEIFKPLNTGWIDGHVACVREWVANIFFYRKGNTTVMIDAGYNYDRLAEKMGWLGIAPENIRHILITHQDTDHIGARRGQCPRCALARRTGGKARLARHPAALYHRAHGLDG